MIVKIEEQKNYTKLESVMVDVPITIIKINENAKYAYILSIKEMNLKIDICQYETLKGLILYNTNFSLKIVKIYTE